VEGWIGTDFQAVLRLNPEGKAGRVLSARNAKRVLDAMNLLTEALQSAGLLAVDETDKSTTGPQESDPTPTSVDEAGPSEDDDTRLQQLIEIEIEETEVILNA